jgi:transcriptional regulator with XRE-family HTH domain
MNLAQALGYTIRKARLANGMTLRDLSVKSNTSLGYLSEIERGTKEVSSTVLESIARGLNTPLYTIVSGSALEIMYSTHESISEPSEHMENLLAL